MWSVLSNFPENILFKEFSTSFKVWWSYCHAYVQLWLKSWEGTSGWVDVNCLPFPARSLPRLPLLLRACFTCCLSCCFSQFLQFVWEEHYEFPPVPSEIQQPAAKALGPHDLQSLRGDASHGPHRAGVPMPSWVWCLPIFRTQRIFRTVTWDTLSACISIKDILNGWIFLIQYL